ncbi:MAG: bifunctional diguanylate cyclase/phosphodiesterase [Rhizobiaceae bacterium]|nr:bifunctional diguanylate cyclase/phosphodiesterase [Rhizobiaceae bacterium]
MQTKSERFGELLLSAQGNLDAFLTGLARDPDAETRVRTVAGLADIDSFAIFDRRGQEVFRSRSDRYDWLLRDRAGGISSGGRLSDQVLGRPGSWQVVNDDGKTNPSIVTPLIRDGQTVGYLSVVADMLDDRAAYTSALTGASLKLLVMLLVATGLPTLFYVRRHRKIVEADDRIQFLANHDPLTHLFNRTRMQQETERVLSTSRATREEMAFCFVDIDGLSEINNSLGQAQGDELLRHVASRINASVDRTDLIARIGADDFTILHRRVEGPEDVIALVRRIRASVGEPIDLKGQIVRPQVSIGVAMMPRDGRTHGELVRHAELAVFHQKTTKTGEFTLFDTHMDEEVHRRRQVEAMVRAAVAADGFELFYQPIVSGDGTELLGFEALIRMPNPDGGYISPADFIAIAETRGYIKEIGTWVIRQAARQIAEWPDHLFVSVNLSAVQFQDGDLVGIVQDALASAGIEGRRLEIEVVESLLLERSEDILGQLNELKALGVSIDMDDFGTGYSSLGYLWRFPFDKLKIDQSFMVAFDAGEQNVREILDTIISLAHIMHMKVTAEGVETEAQVAVLSELGCDQLQGYHFGRPMPADRIAGEVLSRFAVRSGVASALASATPPASSISAPPSASKLLSSV